MLEHVVNPHDVLREWSRVIRPGVALSLMLPCDPGFAWRPGRCFGVRSRAENAGIDYDYRMAREHVNSIFNLVTFIRYQIAERQETWWPIRVPFADLNLIYTVNIRL